MGFDEEKLEQAAAQRSVDSFTTKMTKWLGQQETETVLAVAALTETGKLTEILEIHRECYEQLLLDKYAIMQGTDPAHVRQLADTLKKGE